MSSSQSALTEAPVEALRTLFLDDLLSRPLSNDSNEKRTGGLVDRAGNAWVVFDIDGTREAARTHCASSNGWASDDPRVQRPRKLCHLARFGDGLTSS
jgi:hypothetical protein